MSQLLQVGCYSSRQSAAATGFSKKEALKSFGCRNVSVMATGDFCETRVCRKEHNGNHGTLARANRGVTDGLKVSSAATLISRKDNLTQC